MGEPVTCTGAPHADAAPFLSSPYKGYADINSYFDHDLPDYAVDGKIVTTTGLVADGTPSYGVFPAYWSSKVRQYISYDGHNGYDYGIVYQPVFAAAKGVVSYAGWESTDPYFGYGQMIVIKHRYGYMTLYGHLSKVMAKVGEHVKAGQQIGVSGTTGHSTGPHLHFTVYHNCGVVDPYGWNGKGKDPLISFNGQGSTYLWKSSDAPEILNPLPQWPTFASATKARSPQQGSTPDSTQVTSSEAGKPVALKHLLLLKIPNLHHSSADRVLEAFQYQLIQERERIARILSVLKSDGLMKSYSLVGTGGAIRVNGTLPAQDLLGLPGVAAIVGDTPLDEAHVNQSFNDALVNSVRRPHLVSLFPSTYFDSQWTWRLSVTAEEGGPYVLGFTQAGAKVRIKVWHGEHVVARGAGFGDKGRGGFAITLAKRDGSPFEIGVGDSVVVSSEGKTSVVQAVPLAVSGSPANNSIVGYGPAGSQVRISEISGLTGKTFVSRPRIPSTSKKSNMHRFSVSLSKGSVRPGDESSVSVSEASGNSLVALGSSPGFQVTEGSAAVDGWSSPNLHWRVDVFARHHWRAAGTATASADGYVQILLRGKHHRTYAIASDNHLRFRNDGSIQNWLSVPEMNGKFLKHHRVFVGTAPVRTAVYIRVWSDSIANWKVIRRVTGKTGRYVVRFPADERSNTSVTASVGSSSGSLVQAVWTEQGTSVDETAGLVSGTGGPGETVALRVLGKKHDVLGEGVAVTNSVSGSYAAYLYKPDGRILKVKPGQLLVITDGSITTSYRVPAMRVQRSARALAIDAASQSGILHATFTMGDKVVQHQIVHARANHHFWLTTPHRSQLSLPLEVQLGIRSSAQTKWTVELTLQSHMQAGIALTRAALESATAATS